MLVNINIISNAVITEGVGMLPAPTYIHKHTHTLFVNVGRKVAAKKAAVDLPIIYTKL